MNSPGCNFSSDCTPALQTRCPVISITSPPRGTQPLYLALRMPETNIIATKPQSMVHRPLVSDLLGRSPSTITPAQILVQQPCLCSKYPGQFLSKLQIANPGNQKSLDILAIFLNSIFYLSPWRVSKNSIGNLPSPYDCQPIRLVTLFSLSPSY